MSHIAFSSFRYCWQQVSSLGFRRSFSFYASCQKVRNVRIGQPALNESLLSVNTYCSTRPPLAMPVRPRGRPTNKHRIIERGAELSSENVEERSRPADRGDGEKPIAETVRSPWLRKHWAVETVEQSRLMSVEQWQELKSSLRAGGEVRDDCFESRMMSACADANNFTLGHSLMRFIEASDGQPPNKVTLSKYMRLCGRDTEGQVSEATILDIYSRLTKDTTIVDYDTADDIIQGVCRTSRWRDSLDYLEMMWLTNRNYCRPSCLTVIILAAFRNGDDELGWKLLHQLSEQRYLQLDEALMAWVNRCREVPAAEQIKMVDRLLFFLRDNEILIGQQTAEHLKYFFESSKHEDWHGRLTTVNGRGVCKSCGNTLESIQLSAEEFEELRSNFIGRVIESGDVYKKTTPAELQRFKNFVHFTAPYSVVIDGLNVAFAMSKQNLSINQMARQLLEVIQHISRGQKHKVLILGKQHMKLWPRKYMDVIKREAIVFFTENISKDDPYMLYAAMVSGQGTVFVSRDMLRDHKFCFASDPRLTSFFRKWQWGHQVQLIHVGNDGEVIIKPAVTHNPVAQVIGDHWHIPFDDGSDLQNCLIPRSWLCLKKFEAPKTLDKVQTSKRDNKLLTRQ